MVAQVEELLLRPEGERRHDAWLGVGVGSRSGLGLGSGLELGLGLG